MRLFLALGALLLIQGTACAENIEAGQGYSLSFTDAYALTGNPGFSVGAGGITAPGDSLNLVVTKPNFFMAQSPLPGWQSTGSQTDISLIYTRPLDPVTTGVLSLSARQDVNDVQGDNDVAAVVRIKHKF
ncbi:MAG: hypothetical protein ACAH83_07575 [Alphaproteobacteria bacterium]